MSKTFRYYDFTLTAGASQVILVDAAYFRVQSATGPVDITVEGFGTLPGMLVGQGIKDTPFKRIVIKDVSGAANVGTILVASQEFVDNRTYGVNTISGGSIDLTAATQAALNRPQAQTGFFSDQSALVANTPLPVFLPAANVNGAILLTADIQANIASSVNDQVFISKASAPTTVIDGSVLLMAKFQGLSGTSGFYGATLPKEQYIAAGQGLYFIATSAVGAGVNQIRACRYKLL